MASGVKIPDEVKTAYSQYKTNANKASYLILKLDDEYKSIIVDTEGPEVTTMDDQKRVYAEFLEKLGEAERKGENRFAFYNVRFEYNQGQSEKTKIYYINWNPDTAKIKQKMVYASSCSALLKTLNETGKKMVQCSDIDDLELGAVTKQLLETERVK